MGFNLKRIIGKYLDAGWVARRDWVLGLLFVGFEEFLTEGSEDSEGGVWWSLNSLKL
jgi:hypothetical protein